MILNIQGTTVDGKLKIEIPTIFFDRRYSYKMAIHHLHIGLSSTIYDTPLEDNTLLCLSTNLVDRSANNAFQAACHFYYRAGRKLTQYCKNSNLTFHPLHLYEIENASFNVLVQFTGQVIKLNNIFLQIEILKTDPYGRV